MDKVNYNDQLQAFISGRTQIIIIDDAKKSDDTSEELLWEASHIARNFQSIGGQTENGEPTFFNIYSTGYDDAGGSLASLAYYSLRFHARGLITAKELVQELGEVLGYNDEDIQGFIESGIPNRCKCSCCGGYEGVE